ncbi:MAG: replication initiator protein A [Gammaproteobacteria bacterium]|nr:replication initiator protein A [Gammaproteobacteria bacterium]
MNLAEFPIALLSSRTKAKALSFKKSRVVTLDDGTVLHQEWIVTGSPEYGLPQPSDDDVLLGLLKLAADEGLASPLIHFTRRGILSLMGWANDGRNHKRLERSLQRLATTKILAHKSFWDNREKVYETLLFGIIETLKLFERRTGAPSTYEIALTANWVRFSKEFFESMQAGYIKPLNLTLYFSLSSPVAKRLFRYLDKKRYNKDRFQIGLHQLAATHIGLSEAKCAFPSWIKQVLDPAHNELMERGFLRSASYHKGKDGEWKVVYHFGRSSESNQEQPAAEKPVDATAPEVTPVAIGKKPLSPVVQALVDRGVSPRDAEELVDDKPAGLIDSAIEACDQLIRSKKLTNPGGFLAKAIREEWQLKAPGLLSSTDRERLVSAASNPAEKTTQEERQRQEQELVQTKLESLAAEDLVELRREAMAMARKQIGVAIKLQDNSPVVEAFLYSLVQQRYPETRL